MSAVKVSLVCSNFYPRSTVLSLLPSAGPMTVAQSNWPQWLVKMLCRTALNNPTPTLILSLFYTVTLVGLHLWVDLPCTFCCVGTCQWWTYWPCIVQISMSTTDPLSVHVLVWWWKQKNTRLSFMPANWGIQSSHESLLSLKIDLLKMPFLKK